MVRTGMTFQKTARRVECPDVVTRTAVVDLYRGDTVETLGPFSEFDAVQVAALWQQVDPGFRYAEVRYV